MSLVPLIFSDWWEDLDRPHRLLDQDFGVGLYHDQLATPQMLQRHLGSRDRRSLGQLLHQQSHPLAHYYRPWAELLRSADSASSTVSSDKDKFQVNLDVQQFKPEEINVKVDDKFVIVEAKHEEKKDDHGWISRQFVRKYMIPDQCDLDRVNSSLSSDGVLTITAPRKDVPKVEGARTIQIERTGQPAIRESCESKAKGKKEVQKADKK